MLLLIFKQVLIGMLGILFYNILNFRQYLNTKEIFTKEWWRAFWIESAPTWIWVNVMLISISVIVTISPESAASIETLTQIKIDKEASFLTIGIGLSGLVDTGKRKAITTKK